jgi:predicted MarR family transcription regulator
MAKLPIFVRTFGNSPVIKVLNFLLQGRGLDYSMSDVARNSDISWTTLNRIWEGMEKTGLIRNTRKIGKAKLYRLNTGNEAVKRLIDLHNQLLIQETENYFAKRARIKAVA